MSVGFEQLGVGQSAVLHREVTAEAVERFAELSGDWNPLHMDDAFASATPFGRRVVHGALVAAYVSTMVGTQLPGYGSLWVQQMFRWRLPVFIGDRLEITATVTHKSAGTRTVVIAVRTTNQNGQVVMDGDGAVMLPKVREQAAQEESAA
jgi:3-oxoacyl-[acyl-carrier protein] reductase